ncbi:MAG: DUF2911 domain-containing protein, partial [Chitinophagaceae bacterium]
KIWGGIVHKGFIDQGFGKRNPAPWRAGANENTVIVLEDDVKIEGQALAKGRYGLFIAYDPAESILIFSKKTDGWGSFFYDEKEDALRVKVKPYRIEKMVELLKYEFMAQTAAASTITLSWENLAIPFTIEVDYLRQQYEALLAESQNPGGFTSQGLIAAANWTIQNNYRLEKGLEWATLASGSNFPGDPNSFTAFTTKATLLEKLNRPDEAAATIKTALPLGSIQQLQQYGRQLLTAKNTAAAFIVFQYNFDKHPGNFMAVTGMVRALSAKGDYAKAGEFAQKAILLAPNEAGKAAVEAMLTKLKEGKDIN